MQVASYGSYNYGYDAIYRKLYACMHVANYSYMIACCFLSYSLWLGDGKFIAVATSL